MSIQSAEYFPILRSRQNELLAIRELAENSKLSHVIPIIEPVKASNTLIRTLAEAFSHDATIGIVLNPVVGSFVNDLLKYPDFEKRYHNLIHNHEDKTRFFLRVANENVETLEAQLARVREEFADIEGCNAIMSRGIKRDVASAIHEFQAQGLIHSVTGSFPKPLNYFRSRRVLLTDGFKVKVRNADYRKDEDEFFSDSPSTYPMYGCQGFSDYTIVGEEFKSGGFSPRAVALHITYFDEGDDVRIRHFVSDPPDDTGRVADKYATAVEALYEWVTSQSEANLPRTIGLDGFLHTYTEEHFPGLGFAKKLSIMHHIEMIDWYLGRA
jgi:hypothetical protein